MISPSPAMKTSSPLERKTFLSSPGRFAKPKNLRGIGGGGACGGICMTASLISLLLSVVPLRSGIGITASACDTKMFLPEPSYLICSVEASNCRCKVGSRLCGRYFFPDADPEPWCAPECVAFPASPCGSVTLVAGLVEAMVEEEGMNQ